MGWLRFLLLVLAARPLALFLTGADVVGRERLPLKGPAIVAANHSSHVDTLLLLAIFRRAPWPGCAPWRRPTISCATR